MESIYSEERTFKLTQGSIITNCISSLGTEIDTWGFIITARCDCENHKGGDVYYLPIVNFGDWFLLYEKKRFYDLWVKDNMKNLTQKLNSITRNNISDYSIFSRREIEQMLPSNANSKKQREEILRLFGSVQEDNEDVFLDYIRSLDEYNLIKSDIERLAKNEDNNFLLIPDWQRSRRQHHKIIMLREIKRLKMEMAIAFEDPRLSISFEPNFNTNENDIKVIPTDIYCIDKLMESPYVEYVMQRFTYNFIRIGIDRLETATNENLYKEIKEIL